MPERDRTLKLFADEREVAQGCRIAIKGRSTMSLVPDVWLLDIQGMSRGDYHAITQAKNIRVTAEQLSCIAYGCLTDCYTHFVGGHEMTTLMISDGEAFWHASVSVSVASGTTIEQAIRTVLAHSTSQVPLVFCHEGTIRMIRGQAYHGQTAQAVESLAASMSCRAWIFRGGLYVAAPDDPTSVLELRDDDLPEYAAVVENDGYIIQTAMIGLPIGQRVRLNTKDINGDYRIVSQSFHADSHQGAWKTESILTADLSLGSAVR